MTSTPKACQEMEIETQLFKVLETVDNYSIKGGVLSLNRAKMAPLAKFEMTSRN